MAAPGNWRQMQILDPAKILTLTFDLSFFNITLNLQVNRIFKRFPVLGNLYELWMFILCFSNNELGNITVMCIIVSETLCAWTHRILTNPFLSTNNTFSTNLACQDFMLRPLLRRWSENPVCSWARVTRISRSELQFVYCWDIGDILSPYWT